MVSDVADLESRVFQLSPSEQFDLYTRLRDKFDPILTGADEGVDAAWDEEIERRLREVQSGQAVLVSSEEVEARIDALAARLRRTA